jgi:hypothetical protein
MELTKIAKVMEKAQKHYNNLEGDVTLIQEYDKERANGIKARLVEIKRLIITLNARFQGAFGDLKAEKVFSVNEKGNVVFSETVSSVAFRKTPFNDTVEEYKAMLSTLPKLQSFEFSGEQLGIDLTNKSTLSKTKKFAFKLAFWLVKEDISNVNETLERYFRFKEKDKARNAGINRNISKNTKHKAGKKENAE